MLKNLNEKLKVMRSTREKCEELAMTMEFLQGGAIKSLRVYLKKYNDDPENDTLRQNVDSEVNRLIEIANENLKEEDFRQQLENTGNEERKAQEEDTSDQFGYLTWLHKFIDLNKPENQDICLTKEVTSSNIKEGCIVDAQDYLGEWHLSVVCKVDKDQTQEFAKLNFLRYPKGNRDEWFSTTEISERVTGPFVNSETNCDSAEPISKNINALREYFRKFQAKSMKDNLKKVPKNAPAGVYKEDKKKGAEKPK